MGRCAGGGLTHTPTCTNSGDNLVATESCVGLESPRQSHHIMTVSLQTRNDDKTYSVVLPDLVDVFRKLLNVYYENATHQIRGNETRYDLNRFMEVYVLLSSILYSCFIFPNYSHQNRASLSPLSLIRINIYYSVARLCWLDI